MNIHLRTLKDGFAQKFEQTRHKIAIVSKVDKNRRIRSTNMLLPQPYTMEIKLNKKFYPWEVMPNVIKFELLLLDWKKISMSYYQNFV